MIYLEQQSWPALNELNRDTVDVLVPLGPLEQHGPHLPVGTDALQSFDLAVKVAERCETRGRTAVLHPLLPVGSEPLYGPGSVDVPPEVLEGLVRAILESMVREGFRKLAVITVHGRRGHHRAIFAACDAVSAKRDCVACNPVGHMMADFLSGAIFDDPRLSPFREQLPPGDSHAGYIETSWALALNPGLVAPLYSELPASPRWEDIRPNPQLSATWPGYLGDPRKAGAAAGQALREVFADRVAEVYGELCAGTATTMMERYW